jgi:transposase
MTHTTATYAGLDVSLKETAICIIDETGKVLFEGKVAADPQFIAQYLAKRAPGLGRVGLESGATSAWLWRELRQLGLPVICLDSRHAHRVLSMKRNKNDRNDARGLAELVRMGWYREARVRSIDAQYIRVTQSALDTAREDADVRRMMTVPGIGAITALAFKAALDDPKRFSSSSKVGPYLGLTPRQYQSGDSEWIGGIGQTNDPLLRSYLYEAAGVLMTRVRRSSPLKDWAIRLAKRIGWKRASIATARKLAVILHAIWRDGTVFEWQLANVTAP